MASISEDKLADLSGPDLVAHLSNTHRKADFDAVARILVARDRRNAKLQAELAAAFADLDAATARGKEATELMAEPEAARMDVDALRETYRALLEAFLPPRCEVDEMELMVGAAAPDVVYPEEAGVEEAKEAEVNDIDIIDLTSDEEEDGRAAGGSEEEDEEDSESLSQRIKRLREAQPGELESGKVDLRGQSYSVGTLGNDDQQKSSSVKIGVPVAATGKMVSKPEDSKVSAFVQESPAVKTEKFDGEMPRTMLLPSQGLLGRITIQEGSSKSDYCKAGTGDKGQSSDVVPATGVSQPSKGIEKMNKAPMAESSAKSGNKEAGAQKCASFSIQSEEPRKTRDVFPVEPRDVSNTCVQVKRETGSLPSAITSTWVSEGQLFTSLLNDNTMEICMQALCSLYRQGATVDKRDELRAKQLAEFLLDGDLQGPMKRTAEELQKQNVTNAPFIRKVTMHCSEQLFGIFRSKKDAYFR